MKKIVMILISLFLAFVLTACTTGVPFEKYNAVAARVEELESQLAAYERENNSVESSISSEPTAGPDIITSEKPASEPSGVFDANKVLKQLEKTEYIFNTSSLYYSAIVLKTAHLLIWI